VSSLNERLQGIDAICFAKFRRLPHENLPSALRRWALCIVLAALITFGCGTTHAALDFTAPSATIAGTPFTVTVTVVYEGQRDTVINSQIEFTSSDPAATLPTAYFFTAADAGSMTWPNGFILRTPGTQTISANIYNATGINGTATITVSP
jgi:hypothetical protein